MLVELKTVDCSSDFKFRANDVFLYTPDPGRKSDVTIINPVLAPLKSDEGRSRVVLRPTKGAEAALATGSSLGHAVLMDADKDNTFIKVSAIQGEEVAKLTKDWVCCSFI